MSASRTSDNAAYAPHFIDEVRARTPLDGLAARHVTLKRSGQSLRGPCPIHGSGKTSTSFSVRHNRYRCFACGARGDAISFAMWADRLTFTEAVRRLAHDAGLAVPGEISSAPHDAAAEERRFREIGERRAQHEAKQAAERAADIAAARALWCASVPLDGTLGEQYLTGRRKIAKPAAGWPESLRYHPASRSVIAALTAADGTMQAVHRTLLTPTGDNLCRRDTGRKLKLGRGPQDGACSRLPGTDPALPILLHGEGLETTLSPWSVVGHEGRVYFGRLGDKARPERGRVNVMLVDDDGSDAADRIAAKVEQWTAEGYCVLIAPAFDDIEGGGRDWNDLLQDDGPDEVRDRLIAVIPPLRADLDATADCHHRGNPRGDAGSDRGLLRRPRPSASAANRWHQHGQDASVDRDICPLGSRAPPRAQCLHQPLSDGTPCFAARRGTSSRQCRSAIAARPLSRRNAQACRPDTRICPLARPDHCARRRL